MRIAVVCQADKSARCGLQIAKIGEFRAVEVYMAKMGKTRSKRRFLRQIKRCAKTFCEMGISVCAAEDGFEAICNFGITAITDGTPLFLEMCGDMALLFSEKYSINDGFLITGGSFSNVVEAATRLLTVFRCLYIKNNAFSEIAEEIAERTGVSVRSDSPEGIPELCICNEWFCFRYGEVNTSPADFEIRLPDEPFGLLPPKIIPSLALILKKSGFLHKKEIKVEMKIKNL